MSINNKLIFLLLELIKNCQLKKKGFRCFLDNFKRKKEIVSDPFHQFLESDTFFSLYHDLSLNPSLSVNDDFKNRIWCT